MFTCCAGFRNLAFAALFLLQTGTAEGAQRDTIPGLFIWKDTFCDNQLVLVNNNFYSPSNPSGTEVLPGQAAGGGDSVVVVEFTFLSRSYYEIKQTLCKGDTIWVNNSPYHAMRWFGEEKIIGGAANGCDSIISIDLDILEPGTTLLTDTLCFGEMLALHGAVFDSDQPEGEVVLEGGGYAGCDSIIRVSLAFRQIQASLPSQRSVLLGDTLCLDPVFAASPASVVWAPEWLCPTPPCTQVCFQPLTSVQVSLTASDPWGCVARAEVWIEVRDSERIYLPNVFKPSGAPPNDRFWIGLGPEIERVSRFTVYDRWGAIVFEEADFVPSPGAWGWDGRTNGREAMPGVYVFYAVFRTLDQREIVKSGAFTLLR